jgi:signal peptidase I
MKGNCMSEPSVPTRPRRRWIRWFLRRIEHALALVGLGTIIYFTCFDLSRILSDSMSPTLQGHDRESGDVVLTERVSYRLRQPRRWEVITFRSPEGTQIMKRVVGLPGEHVQMRNDGSIVIDGKPVERPAELSFLHYFPFGNVITDKTAACNDGYYVLGDFSRDSDDSRFNGPVKPEQLVGRAWLIVAPSGRRGFVH